jgi:hypothetical protein
MWHSFIHGLWKHPIPESPVVVVGPTVHRKNHGLLYNRQATRNALIPSGWYAFNGSAYMSGLNELTRYPASITNIDPDRLAILTYIKDSQLLGGARDETGSFIYGANNSYYWTGIEWLGWGLWQWLTHIALFTKGYYLAYQVDQLYDWYGDHHLYRENLVTGLQLYYDGEPIENRNWGMHVRCCKPDPTHTIWHTGYTMVDYDGNVYDTVLIGDTIVTAQNLEVKHFRNGTSITNVTDNTIWANTGGSVYCYYNNDSVNYK